MQAPNGLYSIFLRYYKYNTYFNTAALESNVA